MTIDILPDSLNKEAGRIRVPLVFTESEDKSSSWGITATNFQGEEEEHQGILFLPQNLEEKHRKPKR